MEMNCLKHFYYPFKNNGENKLNENIIQDLPSNGIIGFLEVYK